MTARHALRPILASALLATLVPPALAAEVSAKDAARAARAWVDRGYAMGRLPAGRTVAGVDEVEDPATGARLLVAKFEGGGFVVLSADDLVDPVLAFSETGDGLDLDERNPFWALLRGDIAAREAAAGVERGGKAATKGGGTATRGAKSAEPTAAQAKWAALLADEEAKPQKRGAVAAPSDLRVDSFVESRWNQGTASHYQETTDYCYNYYTTNHYYSGCVATALSQVMWYFGYPTNPVAQASYPCAVDGVSVNESLMGGVYDWASMPARPWETGTTEYQRKAIGKIVHDAGAAVGMNWTRDGSVSSAYTGQPALQEDFGYAQACAVPYLPGENPWSLERFRRNVVPCLDARTPVVLSISVSTDSRLGHAVFADGYGYSDGAFCIHVNFGWGYANDSQTAWYCPPDLQSGYDYDTINGILCNIFPDRTGSVFSGRVTDADGNPVSGATVSFSDGQATTTDANGIYAFVAPAGFYTATASKDGESATVGGTLTQTSTVTPIERTSGYTYSRVSCGNLPDNDIVLNGLEAVLPPVFSPGSCLFYPMTNVTISCADPDATIRFTLDGSDPDETSSLYSGPNVDNGPITVSATVTIKARAFAAGKNPSPVVAATYTYDAAQTAPPGDYFANPIRIAGASGTSAVDNTDFTTETGEPDHSPYSESRTIWFRWTAPGSGTMSFESQALVYDPGEDLYYCYPTCIAVYTGAEISSLVQIAQADTGTYLYNGYNYFENSVELSTTVQQGTTYMIAVAMICWDEAAEVTFSWSGDLVVQKTPYELWEEARGVTGGPAGITAGVANVFRYVFDNTNAVFSPILSALPGPSDGSILRLPAVANTNGVTLKVVSTTNLSDWASSDVDERKITIGQDGTVTLPVGGPVRFFRLKAIVE